jgi:hypothetical protein
MMVHSSWENCEGLRTSARVAERDMNKLNDGHNLFLDPAAVASLSQIADTLG